MNPFDINVLVLAYLGDTIYENYVRKYLISKGISNVDTLQKTAVDYVSAKSQAKYLLELMENNFFNEKEMSIITRARNYKNSRHPKNCDIMTYKYATSLEAVIGYLNLNNEDNRIEEIMNYILR